MKSEEYLKELEQTDPGDPTIDDLLRQRLAALGMNPEEISEAEQSGIIENPPLVRRDGYPRGSILTKPLTPQQFKFAQGVIEGKSRRQAYRDAYPLAKGSPGTLSACAYRLSKDQRIARLIETGWSETVEALAEDRAATQRYVYRQLVSLSKASKAEGSRLKALELLGRAAGMWRDNALVKDEPVSPEQLKRELSGHLKLVSRKKAEGV